MSLKLENYAAVDLLQYHSSVTANLNCCLSNKRAVILMEMLVPHKTRLNEQLNYIYSMNSSSGVQLNWFSV